MCSAPDAQRCLGLTPFVGRRFRSVPFDAQRLIVLADLVALGKVGIEVVLAVPLRYVGDRAAEREARCGWRERTASRLSTGSAPGRPEHGPGRSACSGRRRTMTGLCREALRLRLELEVDLHADEAAGLDRSCRTSVHARSASGAPERSGGPPIASRRRRRASRAPPRAEARPRAGGRWACRRRRLARRAARSRACPRGWPATVRMSQRYIASGSSAFSPMRECRRWASSPRAMTSAVLERGAEGSWRIAARMAMACL